MLDAIMSRTAERCEKHFAIALQSLPKEDFEWTDGRLSVVLAAFEKYQAAVESELLSARREIRQALVKAGAPRASIAAMEKAMSGLENELNARVNSYKSEAAAQTAKANEAADDFSAAIGDLAQ